MARISGAPVAQPGQQLTQGREGAAAQLLGVRALRRPVAGPGTAASTRRRPGKTRASEAMSRGKGRDLGFRQIASGGGPSASIRLSRAL